MSDLSTASEFIEAFEVVKKAREIAWIVCLFYTIGMILVIVGLTQGALQVGTEELGFSESELTAIVAIPLVAFFLQLVFVTIGLGRDLRDTQFLRTQVLKIFPSMYLVEQIPGLSVIEN